jgi:hypothetical protein
MPFTLAHPAAVLPLHRALGRFASWPALIIGSMVPDMHRLFFGLVTRHQSHGAAGLLWFCLPVGLIGYLLYRAVLRAPLHDLLSGTPPRTGAQREGTATVIVSLLAGTITHDLWDLFTHGDSPVAAGAPWLLTPAAAIGGHHVAVYQLLQNASTLLGLVVVGIWLYVTARRHAPPAVGARRTAPLLPALGLGLAGVAVALIAALAVTLPHIDIASVRTVLNVAKLASAYTPLGIGGAVLVYCVGWQFVWRRASASRAC